MSASTKPPDLREAFFAVILGCEHAESHVRHIQQLLGALVVEELTPEARERAAAETVRAHRCALDEKDALLRAAEVIAPDAVRDYLAWKAAVLQKKVR